MVSGNVMYELVRIFRKLASWPCTEFWPGGSGMV